MYTLVHIRFNLMRKYIFFYRIYQNGIFLAHATEPHSQFEDGVRSKA